jgi:hypothetical protein
MWLVRSWLGAALVFSLLATQVSAQQVAAVDTPDTSTLRAIEAQVSRIRGLQPLSAPDLRLLDHTSLQAYLLDEFDRNYLPREREADQKELVALGLIQPSDDLVQIDLNLFTAQVIGIYDTQVKSMFVVSDQGSFGPAARLTYAHEFNHALQDQYYGLNKIAPKHPESNDRSLAVHGLIEGDAIMLQNLWAQENLTQDDVLQLARGAGSDDSLARVPLVVRAELLFPYTYGYNFVRQAFRAAGNSYTAVDSLFLNPPESTSQILHPEKYRNHVAPAHVQLGDVAANLGPDWRTVGRGVLGELDTRVLLQQWGSSQPEAARVAAGWSGDRWQLVEKGGLTAIALKSTWDTSAAASEFFSAYTQGLRTRFADAQVDESSPTRQALTTDSAATEVRLQDSDVLMVIGFDRETVTAIVAAAFS